MKNTKTIMAALVMASGLAGFAQVQDPLSLPEAAAAPPSAAGTVPPPVPIRPQTGLPTAGGGSYGGGYGGNGGGYGTAFGMAPASGANFSTRLQSIIARASGPASGPLLIRFSEMESTAETSLQEDMAVMAHILQKAAAEAGNVPNRAMGVDLAFAPGAEGWRDLYLEGQGLVFMVRVGYPLVAPPDKNEKSNGGTPKDSEWEQAKRELQGEPGGPMVAGFTPEPFREERVSQLKESLLDALKNANNIRGLKPEESITVCVIGPAGGAAMVARPSVNMPGRALRAPAPPRAEQGSLRAESATVLTIRVTKADLQALAKGKSGLEELRNKAKILTYATAAS